MFGLIFKNIVTVVLFSIVIACSKATSSPEYKYKKDPGNGLAAKFAGIEVSQKELHDGIELELYKKELEIFDIKFNKLNSLILEKLMKADPKYKGLTNDQYMNKYIASTVKITEKDITEFVKKNKVPADRINPQIKERIRQIIELERKKKAVQEWIASQTKDSGIEIYFKKPLPPSYDVEVGNAPYFGGDKAKVTIVEFSDFQCPFCAKSAEIVKKIKNKYGNKIKFVFKQFPLPFHSQAKKAAIAALCANEQGTDKFWKLHDIMFADQGKLSPENLKKSAKSVGVDAAKFNKCLDSNQYAAQVQKDIEQGKAIGVKGTPSFFINGMAFIETQNFEKFVEFIDQELSK